MTTLAHLYAQHDGSGTLTIGERTDTVAAEDLASGLEQLLALVVTEAKSRGRAVDVVTQLEGSPRTGLRVEPTGKIVEDPRILASTLTRPPSRRPGRVAGALAVLALLLASGVWAAVHRGEDTSPATDPTPTATPTTRPTGVATATPSAPSTRSTPDAPTLRIRATGDQRAARIRVVSDSPVAVRVRLWPRGATADARSRSVQLRPDVPEVLTLRDLQPGPWQWAVVQVGGSADPVRGAFTVTAPPRRPTPSPTPTASPSAPTSSPTTQPTTSPTTAPTTPQPTQQPTSRPTKKPIKPGENGPTKPGQDGPTKP